MTDEEEPTEESAPEPEGAEPAPPTVPLQIAEEQPKRLQRSRTDKVIAGVCGGLGEYLGVDPVLIRIAAVILVFAGGAGLALYVIGWIAIPEAPAPGQVTPDASAGARAPERSAGAAILGLIFIAFGVLFLADRIWPDFLSWKYVWPVALIAVGAAILVRTRR